jgi:hypothetical protein
LSTVGVSSGIDGSEVGFGFDDASGEKSAAVAADEEFAEKIVRDEAGIAGVERTRKRAEAGKSHGMEHFRWRMLGTEKLKLALTQSELCFNTSGASGASKSYRRVSLTARLGSRRARNFTQA